MNMKNYIFIFLMGMVSLAFSQQQKDNKIIKEKIEITPTGDTIVRTPTHVYIKNGRIAHIKKQEAVATPTFKYVPNASHKQRMTPVNSKKEIVTHTMRYVPGKEKKDTIKK